jgi:hypothetical protein
MSEYQINLFRLQQLVVRARNNNDYFGMITQDGMVTGSIHDAWAIQFEITTAVCNVINLVNDLLKCRSNLFGIISPGPHTARHYFPLFIEDNIDPSQTMKRLLINTYLKNLIEMHSLIKTKVLPSSRTTSNPALSSHHQMVWEFFTLNRLSKLLKEYREARDEFECVTLFVRMLKYVWENEARIYRTSRIQGIHGSIKRQDENIRVIPTAITLSSNVMRRAMEFVI